MMHNPSRNTLRHLANTCVLSVLRILAKYRCECKSGHVMNAAQSACTKQYVDGQLPEAERLPHIVYPVGGVLRVEDDSLFHVQVRLRVGGMTVYSTLR